MSIILSIAALAIPSLLSSRQRAQAASAVGALKAIGSAETSFMLNYSSYSPTLAALGDSSDPTCIPAPTSTCQIDGILAAGSKAGYVFTYTQIAGGQNYSISADPINPGEHFEMSSDGIIHYDQVPCTPSSPVLQ